MDMIGKAADHPHVKQLMNTKTPDYQAVESIMNTGKPARIKQKVVKMNLSTHPSSRYILSWLDAVIFMMIEQCEIIFH